jgi:hypothetical protein
MNDRMLAGEYSPLLTAEKNMRERPVSVTIFGILNIGFGLFGVAGMFLSTLFEGSGSPAAGASSNSLFATWTGLWNAISSDAVYMGWHRITVPLDAACTVALAAAGIGLLLLKNWSRLLSLGCAIYEILVAFLDCAVMFVAARSVLAVSPQAGQGAYVAIAVGSVIVCAFALAYPIFLLYFLTRPKVVQAFRPDSPL